MTTAQRNEIKTIVSSNKNCYGTILKHRHPELTEEIKKETSFLDVKKFSTRVWYVINNLHDYPSCKNCGEAVKKDVYKLTDPRMDYCSLGCACSSELHEQHRKESCVKKHGVDHPMKLSSVKEKVMMTNIERRGVAHVLSDPKVIAKRQKTFEDHCKEDQSFKSKIAAKIKSTTLKNHGYENFMSSSEGKKKLLESSVSPEAQDKRRTSKMTNFFNEVLMNDKHVTPLFSLSDYLTIDKKAEKHLFRWKCKDCGNEFERPFEHFVVKSTNEVTFARCPHCHPFCNKSSLEEKKVAKILERSLNGIAKVICNKEENFKVIAPYQIDILIKDIMSDHIICGIEYNGSRWHSLEMGSTLERQLRKTKRCEKAGIPLVHIWEDEWQDIRLRKHTINFIYDVVTGKDVFNRVGSDCITVNRDMFSKALTPNGYELIDESEPIIHKRTSSYKEYVYSVPDCGTLTYKKVRKI